MDSRRWRTSDVAIVGGLMAVAGVLNLVATSRGPGLAPDSIEYLAAGINLANSDGLTMLGGEPMTVFPPGFSAVVAFGEIVGVDAQTTSRVFTTLCLMATVLLAHLLLRKVVRGHAILYGGTVLLAVSPVLLDISKIAWSEPPFIVATLLFLFLLGGVWERRTVTSLELAGLVGLCWLAFLFRYVGVSLIATGVVALWLALRPTGARSSLLRIGSFAALAAALPVVWMLRNHAVGGTLLGPRADSADSIVRVVEGMAETFGAWVVPVSELPDGLAKVIGVVAGIAFVGLVVGAWRRANHRAGSATASETGVRSPYLWAAGIIVPVYVAFLTWGQLTTLLEPIGTRLLSPVYVPLLVIAAGCIEQLLDDLGTASRRLVLPALALLAVFVVGQSAMTVRDARAGSVGGIGFNGRTWIESDLADSVADLPTPEQTVVYTNSLPGLWAATGLQPMYRSPSDVGWRGAELDGQVEVFAEQVSCADGDVVLAWYASVEGGFVTDEELQGEVDLEVIDAASDGILYSVRPKVESVCSEPD